MRPSTPIAKARFKNTLMIAVSGYGRESDRRLSREAGFDDHFVKPVDLETSGMIKDGRSEKN
jgi:hypothetical protein